ncbi:MAG: TIR domain-containing protein [Caulobacterales bacterium]
MDFPSRYDFALSFSGSDRRIAEALFNALSEFEMEVFYDKNEQHRILAEDVEEYLAPIYASDAQLVVCILGPDYPKKIWTKFESTQFKDRFRSGEVIPIVLSTAPLGVFDSAAQVGHIDWDAGGDFDGQIAAAADLLVRKSADVRARLKREGDSSAVGAA